MSSQNTTNEKNYFRLYLDAEGAINNAHDTLTAALCAMDRVETDLNGESLGDDTASALYGIRSIIRRCRDDLADALDEEKAGSMPANCE